MLNCSQNVTYMHKVWCSEQGLNRAKIETGYNLCRCDCYKLRKTILLMFRGLFLHRELKKFKQKAVKEPQMTATGTMSICNKKLH